MPSQAHYLPQSRGVDLEVVLVAVVRWDLLSPPGVFVRPTGRVRARWTLIGGCVGKDVTEDGGQAPLALPLALAGFKLAGVGASVAAIGLTGLVHPHRPLSSASAVASGSAVGEAVPEPEGDADPEAEPDGDSLAPGCSAAVIAPDV